MNPIELGSYWQGLHARLESGLEDLQSIPTFALDLDKFRRENEAQWFAFCVEHQQLGDQLVNRWIADGHLHTPEVTPLFLLACRVKAAMDLIRPMVWIQRGQWVSVFPVPEDEDWFLHGLLIDWWWNVGQTQLFESGWRVETTIE